MMKKIISIFVLSICLILFWYSYNKQILSENLKAELRTFTKQINVSRFDENYVMEFQDFINVNGTYELKCFLKYKDLSISFDRTELLFKPKNLFFKLVSDINKLKIEPNNIVLQLKKRTCDCDIEEYIYEELRSVSEITRKYYDTIVSIDDSNQYYLSISNENGLIKVEIIGQILGERDAFYISNVIDKIEPLIYNCNIERLDLLLNCRDRELLGIPKPHCK